MALNVTGMKRVFKFGNRELEDPDKNMTPDEVMQFYSATYPELTTSNVHGPKVDGEIPMWATPAATGKFF